ncbi:alpha-ketoglutarate-dependent dioxygenase AlkB [Candidatus Parcubacteria bacterium]|nr:alpha-ketoglutarate-dependent dioxygenase AlkB [Candidatus Parcubacteria bacterium]
MRGVLAMPQGLVYKSDFISADQERQLLEFIKKLQFHRVVMHGQAAKRVVRHFGVGYNFETRLTTTGEPMPGELSWLAERAEELAELKRGQIVEALVTRYPVGATIGWHSDAEPFGVVVGISLQAPCIMRFQRREAGERYVYERILNPRSAYVLRDEVRQLWQHHIPATKQERYSITFRTLRYNSSERPAGRAKPTVCSLGAVVRGACYGVQSRCRLDWLTP